MDRMKDYKQLLKQLPSKTLVCAFGEFNPPTVAHELLVKTVKAMAEQKNSDHVIYTVPSKNNLIQEDKKEHYLKLMFPNINFSTFTEFSEKYNKIIVVTGTENLSEVKKLKEHKNIEIISISDKTVDLSSKMKQIASKGVYEQFKKNLPSTIRDMDGRRLMNDVRLGMGLLPIKEQLNLVKDTLREEYFHGKVFNVDDIVESNDIVYQIAKRGSNHLLLRSEDGTLISKWLHEVKQSGKEFMLKEDLTSKTLKPADTIKVARIIATMLGIDKVESTANPENLVNSALRKVRSKTLNPEAMSILHKMLSLATEVGIKYDVSLVPAKIKEGVIQPNGTDKIDTIDTTAPIVSFRKFKNKIEEDNVKDNESDMDAENQSTEKHKVGGLLVQPYSDNDNLRRRKVKYHLGEGKDIAKHVVHVTVSDPNHTAVHKRKQTFQRKASVSANSRQNAIDGAITYYKKSGYKVHDHHYVGLKEETGQIDEVSSELLDRYKTAAKKSADDLTAQGKHKKSTDRWMGVMKATGKQIDKTTANIKKSLNREEVISEGAYEKSEENKRSADAAKKQGNMFDHHMHMADYHDNLAQWHADRSRFSVSDIHAKKSEEHHEKAMSLKENMIPNAGHVNIAGDTPHDETWESAGICPTCSQPECSCEDKDESNADTDGTDFTDEEMDKLIDSLKDDDYLEAYEEDELALVDAETGEEIPPHEDEKHLDESALMEVLSRMERMKAKFRLRKTSAKRQRATAIALKRHSSMPIINKRARKLAIQLMKKRFLRGRDPSSISVGEKERIERMIQKRKTVIGRLASKLAPRVRGIENARLSHHTYTKKSTPSF